MDVAHVDYGADISIAVDRLDQQRRRSHEVETVWPVAEHRKRGGPTLPVVAGATGLRRCCELAKHGTDDERAAQRRDEERSPHVVVLLRRDMTRKTYQLDAKIG